MMKVLIRHAKSPGVPAPGLFYSVVAGWLIPQADYRLLFSMWNTIVESGIIALLFGAITTFSGIIITNNFNKKREQRDRKYLVTQEIYQQLVAAYDRSIEDVNMINKNGVVECQTDAIIIMFQTSERKQEELESAFLKIRYILDEDIIKVLDSKFGEIEAIHRKLKFTSVAIKYRKFDDYDNVVINDEVELIEDDKFPEYIRIYIDGVNGLERKFRNVVEKELRKLLK